MHQILNSIDAAPSKSDPKQMPSETRKRNGHDGNPAHRSMIIIVMDILSDLLNQKL